ncbi:DUF4376 domain-containing protein [Comamonas aquatica]|uniref:DUF4376 domain-containing protein n=1 Tax=Comamonas aquatica TaxID=225991 RepID=UPI0022DD0D69|nr:DUF4376 domain-containing protein [Comamonas aquatica]WBM43133.1 DUF4376 domain-containing protein [Comamonas aquatica]
MEYFKDEFGTVYAYPKGTSESLRHAGVVRLSEEEEAAHLNPGEVLTIEALKDAITQKRWEVETGGITLTTGVRVATGIDDQNRITSVVANAERAGLEQVDFKAADGWAKVTLAELQTIATAVALHVQACFSAERAHHEAIDALVAQHQGDAQALQAALDGYDESQGWPVG